MNKRMKLSVLAALACVSITQATITVDLTKCTSLDAVKKEVAILVKTASDQDDFEQLSKEVKAKALALHSDLVFDGNLITQRCKDVTKTWAEKQNSKPHKILLEAIETVETMMKTIADAKKAKGDKDTFTKATEKLPKNDKAQNLPEYIKSYVENEKFDTEELVKLIKEAQKSDPTFCAGLDLKTLKGDIKALRNALYNVFNTKDGVANGYARTEADKAADVLDNKAPKVFSGLTKQVKTTTKAIGLKAAA